ncbi:FKBP-type peptidyl-prolyl cis-trans isomerase [Treponema phagedenis]|uniref:Peptidyl-prolyl cis-trans isomerase n=1 Tax=Treponema phagedenis TaxID=162 RepID=A0A0B7GQY3_TREPH|nr:FKBP-type peptidyl-prolyl cis-trans isomerase [Treponema phagedenis]NVP24521.1 FKBP-type peptidyl-prolyl cis-trans isomerase [Treponema phagedenis]QKS92075.1 FKBP-type peptidyl-prolyl cis-trans isomerase [Treponema phagedenis]QLC58726.1 FKBP-type peptidyl-prolyl cis-trans isomerase [Treponema phagedenis]QSH93889.1 FKBP-type peptidyl-prolyl cis-trans isomerase [Treponema phagedenis]QSH99665.1 FKBP-type peptidyl-prolyl cis-trans isomerase [Treponema phagedenis]
MKKHFLHFFAVLTVLLLAFSVSGCKKNEKKTESDNKTLPADKLDPAKQEELPPPTKKEIGYAFGVLMGDTLKNLQLEIDTNQLMKGFKAGTATGNTKEKLADAQKVLERAMQEMHKKLAKENEEAEKKFLEENAKKTDIHTTESGLQYQIIKEGTGKKPVATDMVKVHYTGKLLNGDVFDSSYDRGQPIEIPLSAVVKGWTEGLALMPVGSIYKLFIPAKLGYGEQGVPQLIPPNSLIIFEVELLEILPKQDEAKPDNK